jgi:hypothetical protein
MSRLVQSQKNPAQQQKLRWALKIPIQCSLREQWRDLGAKNELRPKAAAQWKHFWPLPG